jgi:hypothetical protein
VRIDCRNWGALKPDDVAWVAEWQLAAAAPWLPLRECPVAAVGPGAAGSWRVTIRIGTGEATARLPGRDLAKVIGWCYSVGNRSALFRPPAGIRGSLFALRRALRRAAALDVLDRMGYAGRGGQPAGPGT